jgi:hypothetical protein
MRWRVAARMMPPAMYASAVVVTILLGTFVKGVVPMIQRGMSGADVAQTTPLEMIAVDVAVNGVAEQPMPPAMIAGADVAETTLGAKSSIAPLASPDEIATCPGSYHWYIKYIRG